MTVEILAAWILSAMMAWVPPVQQWKEGEVRASDRYAAIAQDIAKVALDPEEAPLFEGPQGRAQTALLIASIASFESFFRFDVDSGKVQGDHGKSWCLMQVQVHGKTAEGWRGTDLVGDRQKCLKAGLHIMRGSFQWCRGLKLIDRLAGYTTGTCKEEPYAQQRMRRALVWWKDHPFTFDLTPPPAPMALANVPNTAASTRRPLP